MTIRFRWDAWLLIVLLGCIGLSGCDGCGGQKVPVAQPVGPEEEKPEKEKPAETPPNAEAARPEGDLLNVNLVLDGSADPPGDVIVAKVRLERQDAKAKLQVRALLVEGELRDKLVVVKSPESSAHHDAEGNFLLLEDVVLPGEQQAPAAGNEASTFEQSLVIPYAELAIPVGKHALGYEVRLIVGDQAIASLPTKLTYVTITDKSRKEILTQTTRTVPAIEMRERPALVIRGGEIQETTLKEEVVVSRPVHSTGMARVEIKGEFKRDDVEHPFKIRSFAPPDETGPPLPQPTPQPVVSNKEYVAEPQRRIYFATNRQHIAAKTDPDQKFPGKLNTETEAITYGNCLVSIPIHHHTPGKIEQPPLNWWFLRDPEKYFLIEGTSTFRNGTDFFTATSQDDLLVYIHGYNNKFSDAILRSAQLQHDMKFPGKLVAFSWPSAGNTVFRGNLLDPKNNDALLAYNYDLDVAKKSVDHLATVLESLIAPHDGMPPRRVHLLAHSMGNRVLTLALQKLTERGKLPAGKKVFGSIVLAAADLESNTFAEIVSTMTGSCERLSFYYSKDDLPLKLSLARSGNKPIGLNPVFSDGMDTICADGVNSYYLGGGHLYLGEAPDILVDLRLVLTQRKLPDQRLPPLLKKIKAPDLDECYYWVFK